MTTSKSGIWAVLAILALIVFGSLNHPEIAVEVAVIAICGTCTAALLRGRKHDD